ncbi:MAG TPA: hypothetical protein VND92_07095 [Vicinamibacterales bacterium]|nr:hypothetical protein [Vicinamibacterales bacterium]
MSEAPVRLTCGCQVETRRDFLGRVVGTIVERGEGCTRPDHAPGQQVVMPGRENAAG